MAFVQSMMAASILKIRQNVKETKERIIQLREYQNPNLMKKIKQLQKQIHKLSYSTINDLQKTLAKQQDQQNQLHKKDLQIEQNQKELTILENIIKNKYNQHAGETTGSHHNKSRVIEEQKNMQLHKDFLKFLEDQPQKLIEERLAHSKQKYSESFSDKKYAQLNKYLIHKKTLYQKLNSLKPGTTLYTSHQRVLLKQYLDWLRKWNQELTQKIERKSSVHQQFAEAKRVYLNSCKKLGTLILQQKKE